MEIMTCRSFFFHASPCLFAVRWKAFFYDDVAGSLSLPHSPLAALYIVLAISIRSFFEIELAIAWLKILCVALFILTVIGCCFLSLNVHLINIQILPY